MIPFIAISIISLAAFILFRSNLGALARGFISLFIKDIAKTPEGAQMIYDKAIKEKQGEYNQAMYAYQQIHDTLSSEISKLDILQDNLRTLEQKCENLVRSGQIDQAKQHILEREDLLKEIDFSNQHIDSLKKAEAQGKEVVDLFNEKLHTLKREKDQMVNELRVGQQLTNAFNSLNELKNGSINDDLLDAVKDNAQETTARAVSTRIVYESKIPCNNDDLSKKINRLDTENYLENLKQKIEAEKTNSNKTLEFDDYKNKRKIH